jgi:hypothetical protein
MSMNRRVTTALVGVGLALSLTACSSNATSTTDATAANEAYCTSSQAVLSELSTLKDMVTSGDSTRNEISDQGTAVVDATTSAYRASDNLGESVRADIQAADKTFREAIRAIPASATAAEATQAYMDAMDAYNTSIDAVRTSLDC